jgi:hypothetical protein
MVTTMRGLPGSSHTSSISERRIVCVAIWSFAGPAASKTLLIASSNLGNGTLFRPLPIN